MENLLHKRFNNIHADCEKNTLQNIIIQYYLNVSTYDNIPENLLERMDYFNMRNYFMNNYEKVVEILNNHIKLCSRDDFDDEITDIKHKVYRATLTLKQLENYDNDGWY